MSWRWIPRTTLRKHRKDQGHNQPFRRVCSQWGRWCDTNHYPKRWAWCPSLCRFGGRSGRLRICRAVLYRYESKSKNIFGREALYQLLNFTAAKNLFNDHLVCKLAAEGLLCSQKLHPTFSSSDVFVSSAMYGRRLPQVKLIVYYTSTWGKTHSASKIENSNQEDRNRAI